ncbi:hypothetical protein K1T71_004233 [Dendrolimus kikuchii]|uniref:Uncharacterized protein n=1 Tax=Dendrolimus kikuchii TaxID=765133 RepID=A0ACC1D732_9NEOP|nr:hypothetical protein K1T71_004233 [Dendrolimus kikuchii]
MKYGLALAAAGRRAPGVGCRPRSVLTLTHFITRRPNPGLFTFLKRIVRRLCGRGYFPDWMATTPLEYATITTISCVPALVAPLVLQMSKIQYFATVHSLLQYGTELWARAADWQRAFRMQKRAVRAIVRVRRCESARPLFKKLGILTLPSILIYQVAVYVRLNVHTYAKQSDVHTHFTRHRNDMSNIKHKLEKSGRLTHVMGPLIYNKLPSRITESPSVGLFKTRLRKWLVEHTFYKHEEFISHNMI